MSAKSDGSTKTYIVPKLLKAIKAHNRHEKATYRKINLKYTLKYSASQVALALTSALNVIFLLKLCLKLIASEASKEKNEKK